MFSRPLSGIRRALATACVLSVLASPAVATDHLDAGFADEIVIQVQTEGDEGLSRIPSQIFRAPQIRMTEILA